ncbi:MAG: TIGR03643 family protein [Pseudomonadota bacterium]
MRSFPSDWPTSVRDARPSPEKPTDSEVIELAWCDDTTFDSIKAQTGMTEAEVIKLMRTHLKPGSFRLWRKRVSGRAAKHEAKRARRSHRG